MNTLVLALYAAHHVYSLCELPHELDAKSIPSQFQQIPFSVITGGDGVIIDCFWIGAKYNQAISFFIFGGSLMCDNSTGKWVSDSGYDAPPTMSCLSSDVSLQSWPEYYYLFDVQETGSTQMLIVFQGSENYCPLDAKLQLVEGTEMSELRCMGKGGNYRATFRNGTSADIRTPTTRCAKRNIV